MGQVRRPQIERYLPHAFVVTVVVAVLPVLGAVVLGGGSVLSTLVAMLVSLGLTHVGAVLWQYHPGSEDVVFGDLMLWTYLRRLHTPRDITRRVQRLGLDTLKDTSNARTPDQQMRLLKRLAASLEAGDPYTHGHSQRVSRHALMIARAMRLPRRQRAKIRVAGLLHDVGKLYVPSEVLNKPGKLTDDEFEVIKRHAALGGEIVARLGDPELTAIVRHHHERMDGTGYPDKRAGRDIPLGARIMSVADTFDALTSRRPYRPAQKHRLAIEILKKEAGKQLDPDVVKAFLSYYSGRRSVSRWSFMSNGMSHAVNALWVWGQRVGLSGIANAAVAGGTAVAMTATPVVSSAMMKRDVERPHALERTAEVDDDRASTAGGGIGQAETVAPDKDRSGPPARKSKDGSNKNKNDRVRGGNGNGRGNDPDEDPSSTPREENSSGPSDGKNKDKDTDGTTDESSEPTDETEPTTGDSGGTTDTGSDKRSKRKNGTTDEVVVTDPTDDGSTAAPEPDGRGNGKVRDPKKAR